MSTETAAKKPAARKPAARATDTDVGGPNVSDATVMEFEDGAVIDGVHYHQFDVVIVGAG